MRVRSERRRSLPCHISAPLGWSSWLLLLGMAVVNLLVATRRQVPDKVGPATGFGLVLVATSGFIHKIAPTLMPSPAVGSGGYVGALAAIFLEVHFGPVGMRLILGAAGLFGLALCHDVVFLWPVQEIRGWLRHQWWRRRRVNDPSPAAGSNLAVRQDFADWESQGGISATAIATSVSMHPPIPVVTASDAPAPRFPTAAITHQRIPPSVADRNNVVPVQPGSPFELPPMEMLEPPTAFPIQEHEAKVHARAMLLERTLLDFGYQVRVVQIDTGPVITPVRDRAARGRPARLTNHEPLADDLAIRPGGSQRPDRGSDPWQDDGRNRSPQRSPRGRAAGRRDCGGRWTYPEIPRFPFSLARTSRAAAHGL